jgi:hypothetical protein
MASARLAETDMSRLTRISPIAYLVGLSLGYIIASGGFGLTGVGAFVGTLFLALPFILGMDALVGRVMVLMKQHSPFFIATVFCLPFLVFFVLFLIVLTLNAADVHCVVIVDIFIDGLLPLTIWPIVSLSVLALVAIPVVTAWFQKGKTRAEIVFTGIYNRARREQRLSSPASITSSSSFTLDICYTVL